SRPEGADIRYIDVISRSGRDGEWTAEITTARDETLFAVARVNLHDVVECAGVVPDVSDVDHVIDGRETGRAIDEPALRHQALPAGIRVHAEDRSPDDPARPRVGCIIGD